MSEDIIIQIDYHPFYDDLLQSFSDKGKKIIYNIVNNNIHLNTQGNISSYIQKYGSLDYLSVVHLSLDLALHIAILKNYNYGFLYFDPADIYIINDDTFIISNLHHCLPIVQSNKLLLDDYSHVYIHNMKFIAPELKDNVFIYDINYNIIFYSLALISIYALNIIHINNISHTKLFFALKRCLRDNIERRIFYYL